jgi:hypothetical protein
MAKATSSRTKKSKIPARDKSVHSTIPAAVFTFCGERQPQEFTDGVASAMAILRALEKLGDVASEDLHGVPAGTIARIRQAADRGGKFAEGVIAALCSHWLSCVSGEPDLRDWVPLSSPWGGDNFDVPPKGCLFFEVDGKAHSVEPNLNARNWSADWQGSSVHVNKIRARAKPITRARFERMRDKLISAREREADKQRAAAEAAAQQREFSAGRRVTQSEIRLIAKIRAQVAQEVRQQVIDALSAEDRSGKGAGLALIDARYAIATSRLESLQNAADA